MLKIFLKGEEISFTRPEKYVERKQDFLIFFSKLSAENTKILIKEQKLNLYELVV